MERELWPIQNKRSNSKIQSRQLVGIGQVAVSSSRLLCRDSNNLLHESRENCDRARHIIAVYRLIG